MTTIIPELSHAQLENLSSQAEAKVYRALRDALPKVFSNLLSSSMDLA